MLELKDDEAVVYMVDSKRLQFTAAVEISYLDKIIQGWSSQMEQVIEQLLSKWKNSQSEHREDF